MSLSVMTSAATISNSAVNTPARATIILTNRLVVLAASFIVVLPNMLFAFQLRALPTSVMLLAAFGTIAMLGSGRTIKPDGVLARAIDMPRLCICLALSLALVVLGGEAHLVYTNWDWLWRDAVLSDLARAPFPPNYQLDGKTFFLRAPLGIYMLPAFIAKTATLRIGHTVLLVQNAVLFALTLYMLATLAGGRAALCVFVFLSFSGLDVLGQLFSWLKLGKDITTFALPSHIEWWTLFQYSSVVTQIFWAPNHALPAYWLVLVALLCARREATLGDLGLLMAASLFWSPFAVIGTLPLAVRLFVRDAREAVATPRFWLSALIAAGFLPAAIYLQIDAAKVQNEFILFKSSIVSTIILFLVIEIPHVSAIREVWSKLDPELSALLAVAIGVLCILPMERVGVAGDLAMRASIPSLMILSIAFAETLAIAWPARRGVFVASLCFLLLGAVTPAQEIVRSFEFAPFAASDCNLVTVWKKLDPDLPLDNYLARRSALPGALMGASAAAPLVEQPSTVCWPDIPFDPRLDAAFFSNAALKRASQLPIRAKL